MKSILEIRELDDGSHVLLINGEQHDAPFEVNFSRPVVEVPASVFDSWAKFNPGNETFITITIHHPIGGTP